MDTCPIDRQVFNAILVRRYPDRRLLREIPVRRRPRQNQYEDFIAWYTQHCELCGRSDRQDDMISCHGCGLIYHVECVIPILGYTYMGEWLCPVCSPASGIHYAD
jgi:hypothetical protein